ncbi:MAG: hypothetical protein ACKVP5_19020 [Aestuariivirga sp.]
MTTTRLERSEILVPAAGGHIGILGLPFRQGEKILSGDLSFLGAIAEMDPFLFGQALPLNLGHPSAAEDQCGELVDQLILPLRAFAAQVRFQFLEKLALPNLLALKAKADQCRNRLASAGVDGLGESFDLVGEAGGQPDRVSDLGFGGEMLAGLRIGA